MNSSSPSKYFRIRVGARALLSCWLVAAARQRRTIGALAALGLALLLTGPAGAQRYTFTNVTDSSQEFEGRFSAPQINAGGTLVISARLDTGPIGIFTKAAGGPTTTIASDATGGFGGFGGSAGLINASGTVAFQGNKPFESPSQGIYTGAGGALTFIAGNEIGSPFSEFSSGGIEAINDAGTVAFYARRRASAGGGEGIFTRSGAGPITTVADSTSGVFSGLSSQPAINAGGSVAFSGDGTAPGVLAGIFVVAPGGGVTTIVDASDGFTGPGTTSLNNSGTVAFVARNGSVQGIFTGNGGALTTVADESDGFRQFLSTPAINNNGLVVFDALLEDNRRGIFTGPDPVADKVILAGETLFGGTVIDTQFRNGLNDNGDIAFKYSLDNGVEGLAVAVAVVPEPAGFGLLVAAGICCLLRRRRNK
ncbi:MAG: choice-of-anchor tandem repeat NxxGxxAF-containing protein [Pirellulales bacterium]